MAYTTIDDPAVYFTTVLWTGNATGRNITTGMDAAMVWYKGRSYVSNHSIVDAVRGTTKVLIPNNTDAEATDSGSITAFNSDNFTIGTAGGINGNTKTYVGWCWKAGTTSGITTNAGTTITPSGYSFSQDAGFALIKYSGNATAGAKVAHGMGKVPKFIITKRIDESGESWTTFHAGIGNTKFINFNTNSAIGTATNRWNDTDPDTVNFTLGDEGSVNASSQPLMAWCFADVQGYQKCGKYTGNNNADGVFVYCGFRPAMVIIRATDTSSSYMWDNKRSPFNEMNKSLAANTTDPEETSREIDFLSNGFKCREARGSHNDAGDFVFYAVAEAPLVNSNGVPNNAR